MDMLFTLAQTRGGGLLGGVQVAPLESPPAWEEYLLVSPWALGIVLVVLGLVAWWVLGSQGKAKAGRLAGGIGVLLGVGVIVLGTLVEVPREVFMRRTREFIAAAARADADGPTGVGALVASDMQVRGLGRTQAFTRERLMEVIRKDMKGRFAVKEHRIGMLRSIMDSDTTGRTQVEVSVTPEAYPLPMTSWWILRWRLEKDGVWRVTAVEAEAIEGVGSPKDVGL